MDKTGFQVHMADTLDDAIIHATLYNAPSIIGHHRTKPKECVSAFVFENHQVVEWAAKRLGFVT
jgi:hypothetical protein